MSRNYSSMSYNPSNTRPQQSYATDMDPSGKTREKDDMVGLNDKFVQLIEKVKYLEDENRKLDTKLKILKGQENYDGNINNIVKQLGNELEEQIDNLLIDQDKLKAELLRDQMELEDTKKNYEEESQKKAEVENDFVVSKKEVDDGHLESVHLALELEELMRKLEFLRLGYDEEIKELQSQVQNETVVLRDDRKRSLDMDEIIEGVKKQYAKMAASSRQEVELYYQTKMDVMVLSAGQCEQEVRDLKREVSDTQRQIGILTGDLDCLRRKEEALLKEIGDEREKGENDLNKAREAIGQLEDALRRIKQDLAAQIREYHELLNLKLTLDMEIATYRKLLEGEEQRMYEHRHRPDVHLLEKPKAPRPAVTTATTIIPADAKKRVLIRVEVESGKVVSEISQYS